MAKVGGKNRDAIILKPSSFCNVSNISVFYNKSQNSIKKNSMEENNNSIETLTKDFKEMGNINNSLSQCSKKLDDCREAVKVTENCASETKQLEKQSTDEVEYASDEFDEYKEEEEFTMKLEDILTSPSKEEIRTSAKIRQVRVQQPKSATSVPTPIRSKSRSSLGSASSTVRRHPKINMSFTNDRTKQIERENSILLNKILNARSDRTTNPEPPLRIKSCNSSVSRKRMQEKIQHDNLIVLKKIQRAKSSNLSVRR